MNQLREVERNRAKTDEQVTRAGRKIAVLIANQQYQNGISSLQTPIKDAEKLETILVEYGYETFLKKNMIGADIETFLTQKLLELNLADNDRFLFYFAGHGDSLPKDESGDEGYIIPVDGDVTRKVDTATETGTFIAMQTLNHWLDRLPCRHKLIILDCCFAGSFRSTLSRNVLDLPEIVKERYDKYVSGRAHQVITSSAQREKALDSLGKRDTIDDHSPFALALFAGLGEGKADVGNPGDGIITATELYVFLERYVGALAKQHQSHQQTPRLYTMGSHDTGEFVFETAVFDYEKLKPAPELTFTNNPYRGLAVYREKDRDLFFGREAETESLSTRLETAVSRQRPGQIIVVTGSSGTGKSSLVRAGLVPALKDKGWEIIGPFRPRNRFVVTVEEKIRGWENGRLAQTDAGQALLIIDNLDEINRNGEQDGLKTLFDLLEKTRIAHQGNFHIVLTVRFDFLPLLPLPVTGGVGENGSFATTDTQSQTKIPDHLYIYPIPTMIPEALKEVIAKPATEKALFFEPADLVNTLVTEVNHTPGALPLLSFTLSELYKKHLTAGRQDRTLTQDDYRELGGVTGALTNNIESLYAKFDDAHKATMRRVLLRLIVPQGTTNGRRKLSRQELHYAEAGENERVASVIGALEKGGMVVGDDEIELVHDALLTVWGRLVDWQNEAKEELPLQQRLTAASVVWQKAGKTKGHLWHRSNPHLEQVKAISDSPAGWLNSLEREFVARSIAKKKRDERTRWTAVTAVIIILSIATIVALVQRGIAQDQTAVAQTQEARAIANEEIAVTKEAFAVEQQQIAGVEREKAVTQEAIAVEQRNEAKRQEAIAIEQRNTAKAQALLSLANSQYSSVSNPNVETYERALLMAVQGAKFVEQGLANVEPDFVDEQLRLLSNKLPPVNLFFGWSFDHDSSIALSPDVHTVLTGSPSGDIFIWDTSQRGFFEEPHEKFSGHSGSINDIVFSSDGELFATASEDGTVRLWRAKDHHLLREIIVSNEPVDLEFLPSENFLAIASSNGSVQFWDSANDFKPNLELRHEAPIRSISYSGNGEIIATATDSLIRIWDSSNGRLINKIVAHEAGAIQIKDIAFSPNGRVVATASTDSDIRLWNVDSGEIEDVLVGHLDEINAVAFSPDGRMLASVSNDRRIGLWDLTSRAFSPEPVFVTGHEYAVTNVVFSKDGNTLASLSKESSVRLWDLKTNNPITKDNVLIGQPNSIFSVAFAPNGQSIVSGSREGDLVFWDLTADHPNEEAITLPNQVNTIWSVTFSPDSKLFASASYTDIRLWDVERVHDAQGNYSGQLLPSWHTDWVEDLAFAPNGKYLASGSNDLKIALWDIAALNNNPTYRPQILIGHRDAIAALAFSLKGDLLASSDYSGEIILWDMKSTDIQPRARFRANRELVWDVAFSPDGNYLAAGSFDNMVRIWDLSQVDTDNYEPVVLEGSGRITSVAYSPLDGNTLASGSLDGQIRLWDLTQDNPSSTPVILKDHKGWVWSIAYSPDGQMLASASADKTVRLWPTLNALLQGACSQAQRNLSWDEWQALLSDYSYEKTCEQYPVHPTLCDHPEAWPAEYLDEQATVCQA